MVLEAQKELILRHDDECAAFAEVCRKAGIIQRLRIHPGTRPASLHQRGQTAQRVRIRRPDLATHSRCLSQLAIVFRDGALQPITILHWGTEHVGSVPEHGAGEVQWQAIAISVSMPARSSRGFPSQRNIEVWRR